MTKHRRSPRRRWFRQRRSRGKRTIPIAPIVGFIGGTLLQGTGGYDSPVNAIMQHGDFVGAGKGFLSNLTGFSVDRGFSLDALIKGWTPILAGVGVHYIANFLGVNRMFARAPSPINKVRI